ncbi:MAG TPA: hypothetical protein VG738_00300 [Chitinophagaceae bacterium]|nr:hypothetical protein [Chitinophagaceae bacterium]
MLLTRKVYLYVIAALVAGWAVYCYNPFLLYFQNDDFTHLRLSSRHTFFQRNSFRPVCDVSVMLDYTLFGKTAAGYHMVNLVLHIACSVLVYFFSRRILLLFYPGEQKNVFAFIASLLFFIYPMHSESVFWILGRSGTLGAIFALLFLLAFVKAKYTKRDAFASVLFYMLALLSYESCWMLLPVAAVLLAGVPGGRMLLKQRKYTFALLAVIFLVYLFLRWKENHELLDNYEGAYFLQGNIVVLLQHFVQLLVRSFTAYAETPAIITVGFCLAFLLPAIWYIRKFSRLKKSGYILLCFVLCLLPYLSLGIDTHGTEGERFLYLPSVFVCLFTAMILSAMQKKWAVVVTAFTCFVYAAQLYVNAGNYRFAGNVVKQTLNELTTDTSKNIIMEGLPRSQHGAMILESGLQHAVMFLGIDKDTADIRISSLRGELKPLQKPYKIVHVRVSEDVAVARYVFTDTALVIYK